MEISVFGVIVAVLGLLSLALPFRWSVILMACCTLFGATEAISIGGTGILPANLFLLFFAGRALLREDVPAFLRELTPASPAFWLAMLAVLGCLGALLYPRILQGDTFVFAIDRADASGGRLALTPLAPVSGNLSQSVYLVGELVLYLSASIYLRRRDASLVFADAILALAALNVAAALIDLGSGLLGLDILSSIKTAQYAIMDGAQVDGLRRISGTFTETSAFSAFSLPLFAFSLSLWLLGYRRLPSGALALASFALLMLSTSTTAYAGLAGYLVVFALSRSGAVDRASPRRKLSLIALAAVGLVLLAGVLAAIDSPVIQAVSDLLSGALFDKLDSDSGVERSAWNLQALLNFVETDGIGVGLGSSRASSFPLVLLGNLGLAGLVIYAAFLYCTVARRRGVATTRGDEVVGFAARQAMFANLIGATISAAVFDLGPCFYLFSAVAFAALNRRAPAMRRDLPRQARTAGGLQRSYRRG
ncbi:hypothetical protein [Burkholderia gladioli]|uniref:hypothetical protein n=1 Tax=Burkholderia gladioli TaxID=28095 RepID=UPI0016406E9A|nr:hypothetical protein [Burkholderia gladioli]MDN7720834.1 hypothetical protein [Burkholderia gladioli]